MFAALLFGRAPFRGRAATGPSNAVETANRHDEADSTLADGMDLERVGFVPGLEIQERLRCKLQHEINDERGKDVADDAVFAQVEYH